MNKTPNMQATKPSINQNTFERVSKVTLFEIPLEGPHARNV